LEPCPEHCPSRRSCIRDHIYNPSHNSCHYHCYHGHDTPGFALFGEQLGFRLPHGLSAKRARQKWARMTVKRLEEFGQGYEILNGNGSCEVVKKVVEVVREWAGVGYGVIKVTRLIRASGG
jgi:hypothetical protein